MAKSKRNFPIDADTSSASEKPQRDVVETDPGYPIVFVCTDTQTHQPWIAIVPAIGVGINTGKVGYTDYRDLMNIVHDCLYSLAHGGNDPRVCSPFVSVQKTGKVMTRQSDFGTLWADLAKTLPVPATE